MKNKQNNKAQQMLKIFIIFIILIFIILQIILFSLNNSEDEKLSDAQVEIEKQNQEKENAKNAENAVILEKLSKMGERDRMEYYFSVFMKAIERKEYEKAYSMLYEEYKKNYFPDLATFEEYAKKTFPRMSTIEHTNIERSGDTYVLFIIISDNLALSSEGKEMKVVIRENNLNDFVMSFSVI